MLSQTSEYALRAMACLACHPDQLTPTPELAKQTAVPANYLAKVLQSLAQSDLILGRRGVGGGYKLARDAQSISLLDVVSAVGSIGRDQSHLAENQLAEQAHLQLLYDKLDEATRSVRQMLADVRLSDLLLDGGNLESMGFQGSYKMANRASDGTENVAISASSNGSSNGSLVGAASNNGSH